MRCDDPGRTREPAADAPGHEADGHRAGRARGRRGGRNPHREQRVRDPGSERHSNDRAGSENLDRRRRADRPGSGRREESGSRSGPGDSRRGRPARRRESRRLPGRGAQGPRRVWRGTRGSDHPPDEPMNIERIRSILGVWAPMAIGLFIILTSINFYFTANLTNELFVGNLESWRLVCSAGAFFVGGVLLLSTFGRYRKTKAARLEQRVNRAKRGPRLGSL